MEPPTPRTTEGLAGERPSLKGGGSLSPSRGDEARREEDTKRERKIRDAYLAAEADFETILRAHRSGRATNLDIAHARTLVKETWARYYKSKTGKALRKSIEATISISEGEVVFEAFGDETYGPELPDLLEKAVRQIKGGEPARLGEPGFFSNKHLQRLYWIFAKKGIDLLKQVQQILEHALKGLKVGTQAKLQKGNLYLLEKAIKPLSMSEVEKLVEEVADHGLAFSVNFLGSKPDQIALNRLQRKGLILKEKFSFPANAYTMQRVSDVLIAAAKDPAKVSFSQMLEMARHVPLTSFENDQISYVERETARHVTGLGEGIASTVQGAAEEAHQIMRYRDFIRETAREGLLNRWSWKDLSSELGRRTGDWARDFDRIARTELQNAANDASATKIARDNEGDDPLVYKMPRRDACRYCVALYLHEGDFERPRIFRLSTLVANGTNIGRRVAQWKPTKNVAHPNCNCPLFEFVGELGGKVEAGAMGDLQAEEFRLYGKVEPSKKDTALAKKLLAIKVTLDGIPVEELK